MTGPFATSPHVGGALGGAIPDDKFASRTCDHCGAPIEQWATVPCAGTVTRAPRHATSQLVRRKDDA